jgi:hypothetical protein
MNLAYRSMRSYRAAIAAARRRKKSNLFMNFFRQTIQTTQTFFSTPAKFLGTFAGSAPMIASRRQATP